MLCIKVVSVVPVPAALPARVQFPVSCKHHLAQAQEYLFILVKENSTTLVQKPRSHEPADLRLVVLQALYAGSAISLGLRRWVNTPRTR